MSGGKNYDEYIARGIAYMALGSAHERDSLQDFLHAQTLDRENAKDSTYYIGELYYHILLSLLLPFIFYLITTKQQKTWTSQNTFFGGASNLA